MASDSDEDLLDFVPPKRPRTQNARVSSSQPTSARKLSQAGVSHRVSLTQARHNTGTGLREGSSKSKGKRQKQSTECTSLLRDSMARKASAGYRSMSSPLKSSLQQQLSVRSAVKEASLSTICKKANERIEETGTVRFIDLDCPVFDVDSGKDTDSQTGLHSIPDLDFDEVQDDEALNSMQGEVNICSKNSTDAEDSPSLLDPMCCVTTEFQHSEMLSQTPTKVYNAENEQCCYNPMSLAGKNGSHCEGIVAQPLSSEKVGSWISENFSIPHSELKPLEDAKPQSCIHLHFNIKTDFPKKIVQTTLDDFFGVGRSQKKTPVAKTSAASASAKALAPPTVDCKKQWQFIMAKNKVTKVVGPSAVAVHSPSTSVDRPASNSSFRRCPNYKFISGTSFVVDAFNYGYFEGVTSYFLTHFHYDHYRGLKKSFNRPIYCSRITANLVALKLRVPSCYIHPLPMQETCDVDGVEIVLYDANHCPGSVMFCFKLPSGKTILHVGDFRATEKMESIADFRNFSIDFLYLDTTYLDAIYNFPRQEEVLEKCVSITKKHFAENKDTVFIVGSYVIGKERCFKAVARAIDSKIWAMPDKVKVLKCLEDEELLSRLTGSRLAAQVHVLAMDCLSVKKLQNYFQEVKVKYSTVVAIKPTGWTHDTLVDINHIKPQKVGNIYIYGLPYSEHSSYTELKRFVQFIKPGKTIPTVGSYAERRQMEDEISTWLSQCDNKRRTYRKKL